jgi:hypothetical protein
VFDFLRHSRRQLLQACHLDPFGHVTLNQPPPTGEAPPSRFVTALWYHMRAEKGQSYRKGAGNRLDGMAPA